MGVQHLASGVATSPWRARWEEEAIQQLQGKPTVAMQAVSLVPEIVIQRDLGTR